MLMTNVIGQASIKQKLMDMVEENRLSHALLFLGKEGSGALSLALAFAQYIVCKPAPAVADMFGNVDAASNTRPCGVCSACTKAEKLIHPDIHYSYPVVTKKTGTPPLSVDYIVEWRNFIASNSYGNVYDWLQLIGAENKQGNITAHECNDIIHKLSLKSFESEYKILIMWMPEYLGEAGNKLLKLIEEPPANTLFILVAENESQILQTILSRTQLVKIPMLENEDVQVALMQRNNVSLEQATQIANISDGNYREALQILQHAEEDWQSLLREWLNAIMKTGPIAQLKWVDEVAKLGREKQKQFLRYFNHLLELSIRMRALGADAISLADNEKDFAQRLNKIVGITQQQAIIEELDKAVYYIERNANAKMLFQALTIKFYHIIANKQQLSQA
jgi:DNA polymerase III subunit delta'